MNDSSNRIESFLRSGDGQKLMQQDGRLQSIASSPDGQKIRERMNKSGELNRALQSGNTDAMRNALQDILSSEEGIRLTAQLRALMGK